MIENPENKRVDELLEQLHDMGISDDMLAVKLKESKQAETAGEITGEDKLEQLKKRLKEHPEDMIILSELMKPKF